MRKMASVERERVDDRIARCVYRAQRTTLWRRAHMVMLAACAMGGRSAQLDPSLEVDIDLQNWASKHCGEDPPLIPQTPKLSRRLIRGFAFSAAVLAATLAGCGGNVVTDSGIYYNRGLENSYNDLLLANIIRAAKGMPTYFSAVGDYNGSLDLSVDGNANIDSVVTQLNEADAGFGVDFSRDVSRNANVTSLETETFVQAMLTPLSAKLFFLLAEGRARDRFDLLALLSVKWVLVPESTVAQLQMQAEQTCAQEATTFPRALVALCRNLQNTVSQAQCAGAIDPTSDNQVLLRSDPTNLCSHTRFRAFVEAITILQPALLQQNAPGTVSLLAQQQLADNQPNQQSQQTQPTAPQNGATPAVTPASNTTSQTPPPAPATLVFGDGSNFALRSPNEILQYLGDVVQMTHGSNATPTITGPAGRSIPIFEVIEGPRARSHSIETVVDGRRYAIRSSRLGETPSSYTGQSLAILKDIISLNTSQSVLPSNPTIFVQ